MNQVYSIPEVKEFVDDDELEKFQIEFNKVASDSRINKNGKVEADFFQELDLGLDEDRDGNLEESPDRRFFKLGTEDLPLENIKWEGKIKVNARSIISPNPELERQRKLELFNITLPIIQQMQTALTGGVDKDGNPIQPDTDLALALYKPTKEILEIQDEKPKDWLPDKVIALAENPELKAAEDKAQQEEQNPLFIDQNEVGLGGNPGIPGDTKSPQQQGQEAETVVPPSEVTNQERDVLRGFNKAANNLT